MANNLNKFLSKPINYGVYKLNFAETLIAFIAGFALAFFVAQVFFGFLPLDIAVGIAMGIIACPIFVKILKNRRINKLLLQFKDMLDSLNTSYSVGKTTQIAFEDAYNDMKLQYGEDSYICLELARINMGLRNVSTIEELLMDFAERSGLDDIKTFADVFYAINRKGGNIKSIIGETKSIICDKIEIEQEIKTITSSSKNSLYVIMCMPLLIVPMISGFVENGGGIVDIITKIVAIIVFVVAFIIGKKVTDIKF
ncbi:MAG: type II secretion system F family protein [Ruminiclostridium sp.]